MSLSGKFRDMLPKKSSPAPAPSISAPISVVKSIHVSYDPVTKQFIGLPAEWEEQVKSLFP